VGGAHEGTTAHFEDGNATAAVAANIRAVATNTNADEVELKHDIQPLTAGQRGHGSTPNQGECTANAKQPAEKTAHLERLARLGVVVELGGA
jgi:hypothetical protein